MISTRVLSTLVGINPRDICRRQYLLFTCMLHQFFPPFERLVTRQNVLREGTSTISMEVTIASFFHIFASHRKVTGVPLLDSFLYQLFKVASGFLLYILIYTRYYPLREQTWSSLVLLGPNLFILGNVRGARVPYVAYYQAYGFLYDTSSEFLNWYP